MTVAIASAIVGMALGAVAAWLRTRGRDAAALGTLGLALAVIVPWPWAALPLALAMLLALQLRSAANAVEAQRAAVASYLATVRVDQPVVERGAPPSVTDALARRALATLATKDAEMAASAVSARPASMPPRSLPSVPPGVRARFMAAMGHELRSPLNSISGFAQLLEDGSDGPLNDAQRENVVLVRRAAGELLTLLTDILDTARIEAGRVRLDRQWIAPVEVLTLALERLRASSDTEVPNIESKLQPGLSPLYVDRARLGQAVFNVLRAVARGRAQLSARVREMREGDRGVVRFELFEAERPISDADAARAFDPDPAARPQGRSLALGLALSVSRDLAQLHGGDARCEPLDGGTNWVVWVPAESEQAPPQPTKRSPRPRRP